MKMLHGKKKKKCYYFFYDQMTWARNGACAFSISYPKLVAVLDLATVLFYLFGFEEFLTHSTHIEKHPYRVCHLTHTCFSKPECLSHVW